MKMERAEPDAVRERGQIGLLGMMSIQEANDCGDAFVIVHGGSKLSYRAGSHPLLAAIFLRHGMRLLIMIRHRHVVPLLQWRCCRLGRWLWCRRGGGLSRRGWTWF